MGRGVAVPEGGFDEDDDCINDEDEEYLQTLEKLNTERVKKELAHASGDDDPLDDDDDDQELAFSSPLELSDLVLYFLDAMNVAHQREPEVVAALRNQLDQTDTARLQSFIDSSDSRREEKRNE